MEKRIPWVDYVKVFACILVVIGHFFQSMVKANILPDSAVYQWVNTTIYYFHVPLFFLCSGFLYQKFSKVSCVKEWGKNIGKKALTLGVPYFVFSIATWLLKTLFSGAVNNQADGLFETLFLKPLSPYWYLYCLFFIFVLTPTFANKVHAWCAMIAAFCGKVIISCVWWDGVYAVSTVLSYEIWFVMGMCICAFDIPLLGKKQTTLAVSCGVLFLAASITVYLFQAVGPFVSFVLGVLACVFVILITVKLEKKMDKTRIFPFLAQYTMPIFLMHTLFAAPVRAVLIKMGLTNSVVQVTLGLTISFAGPVIAATIMKQLKYPEFLLYPGKFIKIR